MARLREDASQTVRSLVRWKTELAAESELAAV
jgi:hypothetical protein